MYLQDLRNLLLYDPETSSSEQSSHCHLVLNMGFSVLSQGAKTLSSPDVNMKKKTSTDFSTNKQPQFNYM